MLNCKYVTYNNVNLLHYTKVLLGRYRYVPLAATVMGQTGWPWSWVVACGMWARYPYVG